jgi:transposase-like protein
MTSLKVHMRAPPATEVCPNCQGQMTVTQVMPISFADGRESVTYKCTKCRSELERTFQPPGSRPAPHPEQSGGLWRRGGFERVR